jgi:hypothetical protein
LLLEQLRHLEWAALPASQRKPKQMRYPKARTEAQAAERIAQLTAMILEAKKRQEAAPDGVLRPGRKVRLPPMPKIAKRAATATSQRARRRPR